MRNNANELCKLLMLCNINHRSSYQLYFNAGVYTNSEQAYLAEDQDLTYPYLYTLWAQ